MRNKLSSKRLNTNIKSRLIHVGSVLCISAILLPGFTLTAEAASPIWDGSITSGSSGLSVVNPLSPYDPDTNPLAVTSGSDLAYVAQQVNITDAAITYTDSTGSGKTTTAAIASYKLTDDIVLNTWVDGDTDNDGDADVAADGIMQATEFSNSANTTSVPAGAPWQWTPIGTDGSRFAGVFDGGGHKISGLYIDRPSTPDQALFGFVKAGGVVENLGVTNGLSFASDAIIT
jgi:hypothetical protein